MTCRKSRSDPLRSHVYVVGDTGFTPCIYVQVTLRSWPVCIADPGVTPVCIGDLDVILYILYKSTICRWCWGHILRIMVSDPGLCCVFHYTCGFSPLLCPSLYMWLHLCCALHYTCGINPLLCPSLYIWLHLCCVLHYTCGFTIVSSIIHVASPLLCPPLYIWLHLWYVLHYTCGFTFGVSSFIHVASPLVCPPLYRLHLCCVLHYTCGFIFGVSSIIHVASPLLCPPLYMWHQSFVVSFIIYMTQAFVVSFIMLVASVLCFVLHYTCGFIFVVSSIIHVASVLCHVLHYTCGFTFVVSSIIHVGSILHLCCVLHYTCGFTFVMSFIIHVASPLSCPSLYMWLHLCCVLHYTWGVSWMLLTPCVHLFFLVAMERWCRDKQVVLLSLRLHEWNIKGMRMSLKFHQCHLSHFLTDSCSLPPRSFVIPCVNTKIFGKDRFLTLACLFGTICLRSFCHPDSFFSLKTTLKTRLFYNKFVNFFTAMSIPPPPPPTTRTHTQCVCVCVTVRHPWVPTLCGSWVIYKCPLLCY